MKSRIIWIILSFLMALSLVLVSCGEAVEEEEEEEEEGVVVEEEEEEEEEEGPPVTGNWWDKFGEPEYGGTITFRLSRLNATFDPYSFMPGDWMMWLENLVVSDWTVDPEVWAFNVDYVPIKHHVGLLVKSWDMPDGQTMILHVNEEARWQDKPPVNGREFTAYDIEHHYHRVLALGSGFTKPSYMYTVWLNLIESVTATDKYTVVTKFKAPSAAAIWQFWDQVPMNCIEAPEAVVAEGGQLMDWRKAVGTGAWMLTDFIPSGSMTLEKNPNYYAYDERHPENQLPYADKLRGLFIPDIATTMAAMRTGKIDLMGGMGSAVDWNQAASLARTNPELKQIKMPAGGPALSMRVDREPFTDINVRKALQLAIDRETIAETYYGGIVEAKPAGILVPEYKEFAYLYDEWPESLKEEYSYNPERARELLAEAGYPDGFKTNTLAASTTDLDLLQILKSQLLEIGVDMEIRVMEPIAHSRVLHTREHDQMEYGGGSAPMKPINLVYRYQSEDQRINVSCVNDLGYDALVTKLETAPNEDAAAAAMKEAEKYALERHWTVQLFPTVNYTVYQPYLKGYNGESILWNHWFIAARLWIDQDMKKSMGR